MASKELEKANQAPTPAAIEAVLIKGDLSALTETQRLAYYKSVCESLGLNPLTQPFEYLKLSGKLVLYAKRDASDQLRKIHGVSILEITKEVVGDLLIVTAKASDKTGRTDVATGAVSIAGLKGEALANGYMKCETKSKRRVTLSICGLGMMDEIEIADATDAGPLPLVAAPPKPDGYDDTVLALAAAAEQGLEALRAAWSKTDPKHRSYLTSTEPDALNHLKARANEVDGPPPLNAE